MLTEKDYCDYETCVALKELGYKTPTSAFYMPNNETLCFVLNPFREGYVIDCFFSHNSFCEDVMTHDYLIDAPTMWEAQKWLREEKKIEVNATSDFISEYHWFWQIKSLINANNDVSYPYYRSYEEALLEGIKEAVKILKEE